MVHCEAALKNWHIHLNRYMGSTQVKILESSKES